MRVTLTTIGKNHSFELARQLHRHQVLSAIFTGYPRFKLTGEKIPPEKIFSFPWLQTFYMAKGRFGLRSPWLDREMAWLSNRTLDRYVAGRLPEGDIFMALSNTGLFTGRKARKRGMLYICDRPCSHIRYQANLVREEYDLMGLPGPGVDPRIVAREEQEYAEAEAITVASHFARRSFVEMGVPAEKLHLIPYGVELSKFHPVGEPAEESFDILFVGQVAPRKGIPYLLKAFEHLSHPRKKLCIVGTVARSMQPLLEEARQNEAIQFLGHCPQSALKERMSRSHVLVLPSVEDGFGMVMAEAMACGCPVIATTNTGAYDLYEDEKEGFIVPIRDPDSIAERLQRLADNPALRQEMSRRALQRVHALGGWNTYGDRMLELFHTLRSGKPCKADSAADVSSFTVKKNFTAN